MRNNHGEGRTRSAPGQESQEVVGTYHAGRRTVYDLTTYASHIAQCYNCHTTATQLWRKDDEGKTVCNAYVPSHLLHQCRVSHTYVLSLTDVDYSTSCLTVYHKSAETVELTIVLLFRLTVTSCTDRHARFR